MRAQKCDYAVAHSRQFRRPEPITESIYLRTLECITRNLEPEANRGARGYGRPYMSGKELAFPVIRYGLRGV
jgi:hypothetical protein